MTKKKETNALSSKCPFLWRKCSRRAAGALTIIRCRPSGQLVPQRLAPSLQYGSLTVRTAVHNPRGTSCSEGRKLPELLVHLRPFGNTCASYYRRCDSRLYFFLLVPNFPNLCNTKIYHEHSSAFTIYQRPRVDSY